MSLKNTISTLLMEGVSKSHFPGAMYAVVTNNKIIACDAVGYKQLQPKKIPLIGNEIYDVASLTKVISTTTLIMKCIEDEKLSLNQKVSTVLSRFKHDHITVYDLLTHSSGLPADIPRASTLKNKSMVLQYVYNVELEYDTASSIVYSDIGFILLGEIIQAITNKPLHQVAQEVIFNPLHMDDTSYRPDKSRCAPTEFRDDDVYQGLLQGQVHDEKSFAFGGLSGHAGLFSTVEDIAKFIQMFLTKSEEVLSNKTQDMMFLPREKGISKTNKPLVRALGWDKPTPGGTAGDLIDTNQTIVHTGFTGCNMWIDKANEIGFVMLSNGVHPTRSNNNIPQYRNKIGNLIMKFKKDGRL